MRMFFFDVATESFGQDPSLTALDVFGTEFATDGVARELKDRIQVDEQGQASPTDEVSAVYLNFVQQIASRSGAAVDQLFAKMEMTDVRGIDVAAVQRATVGFREAAAGQ